MLILVILLTVGIFAYALMRNAYFKTPELFFCLLVVINFDFFYIFPSIGSFYNYGITLLPIMGLLLLEQILKGKIRFNGIGFLIVMYFFLLALGVVTAFGNGQSLILGIKAIKYQFLILVFFIVSEKQISFEKLIKYVLWVTGIFILLANIDILFFNGNLIFANAPERFLGERLNRARFTHGSTMVTVACIIAFASYLRTRSKYYGIISVLFFLHIFLVVQTRMTIIGIIITAAVLVVTIRRLSYKGIFLVVFVVALLIPNVMLFGNFFEDIGLVKKTLSDMEEKSGSWGGRITTYSYYLGQISKAPFLGYGYQNLNWEKSPEPDLRAQKIFKEDIGITHLFYENGILGMLWFASLTMFLIVRIWKIKQHVPEIMAFFVYAYTVVFTLDFFLYRNRIILFGIFLGLLQNYLNFFGQKTDANTALPFLAP